MGNHPKLGTNRSAFNIPGPKQGLKCLDKIKLYSELSSGPFGFPSPVPDDAAPNAAEVALVAADEVFMVAGDWPEGGFGRVVSVASKRQQLNQYH